MSQTPKYFIAVSGGVDSTVLLHMAVKSLPKECLSILHFNHLTRGKASDKDEAFVRSLAGKYDIPFQVERRKKQGLSEAALRKERMSFFKKVAKENKGYVLLAHHLDDQLETFFFRFIRGTQVKGLLGMKEKNGRLLRPLLSITKNEILQYAKKNNIEHREDSTNNESYYFRNRIRNKLLPDFFELTESYGGKDAFLKRFNNLCIDGKELFDTVDKPYDAYLNSNLTRTEYFDRLDIRNITKELRSDSHFVRRLFQKLNYKSYDRNSIQQVLSIIKKGQGKATLTGNYTVEVSCGFFYSQNKKQKKAYDKGIQYDSRYRTFQNGDRYEGKKLKEVFLRRRIPRLERKLLPLMLDVKQCEINWFPGEVKNLPKQQPTAFPFAHLST